MQPLPSHTMIRLNGSEAHQAMMANHFLALDREDSYKRFFSTRDDKAIHAYVGNIDFQKNGIFAIISDVPEAETPKNHGDHPADTDAQTLKILALGECFIHGHGAELAFSVDKESRGLGLGQSMVHRLLDHAQSAGATEAELFYLRENTAVAKLVESVGMRKNLKDGEPHASIAISHANFEDIQRHLKNEFDETLGAVQMGQRHAFYQWVRLQGSLQQQAWDALQSDIKLFQDEFLKASKLVDDRLKDFKAQQSAAAKKSMDDITLHLQDWQRRQALFQQSFARLWDGATLPKKTAKTPPSHTDADRPRGPRF